MTVLKSQELLPRDPAKGHSDRIDIDCHKILNVGTSIRSIGKKILRQPVCISHLVMSNSL